MSDWIVNHFADFVMIVSVVICALAIALSITRSVE